MAEPFTDKEIKYLQQNGFILVEGKALYSLMFHIEKIGSAYRVVKLVHNLQSIYDFADLCSAFNFIVQKSKL